MHCEVSFLWTVILLCGTVKALFQACTLSLHISAVCIALGDYWYQETIVRVYSIRRIVTMTRSGPNDNHLLKQSKSFPSYRQDFLVVKLCSFINNLYMQWYTKTSNFKRSGMKYCTSFILLFIMLFGVVELKAC